MKRSCLTPRSPVSDDAGQITAFVAAMIAGLLLCAGLVLDGGLALSAKTDAMDAAQEAARAGAQALDAGAARSGTFVLDRERGRQAAITSLEQAGYQGVVSVEGVRVTVRVTHHQRTQLLSLAGVDNLTVTATGTAEAQKGVLGDEGLTGGASR